MSTNTKTRSALREALKHEDAALADRIPDAAPASAAPVAEEKPTTDTLRAATAVDASVATIGKVEAPTTTEAKAKAPVKPAARLRAKAAEKAGTRTSDKAAPPTTAIAEPTSTKAKAAPTRKSPQKTATAVAEAKTEPVEKAHAKRDAEEAGHAKKPKSEKVVRDSFSMPASEHAGIKSLRISLGTAGRLASKSEVLRAGLKALGERNITDVIAILDGLPVAEKGKRKKH